MDNSFNTGSTIGACGSDQLVRRLLAGTDTALGAGQPSRDTRRMKRVVDAVIAGALLAATLPLAVALAVIVWVAYRQPPLVWKLRPGCRGVPFRLLGFRDRPEARTGSERRLVGAECGRFGRWLTRSRLAELPSLVNVLRGEMSLVGPPPEAPGTEPSAIDIRRAVRPGLWSLSAACGGSSLGPADRMALDTWYARHASPSLDAYVVARCLLGKIAGPWRDLRWVQAARMEMWGVKALPVAPHRPTTSHYRKE